MEKYIIVELPYTDIDGENINYSHRPESYIKAITVLEQNNSEYEFVQFIPSSYDVLMRLKQK